MGFNQFLELGLEHIADINGYDHILFIVVMCVMYQPKAWKKVLILVTAFTIGHSITLALAALKWIKVDQHFVEFLIPVTILLTAIWNLFPSKSDTENNSKKWFSWNYLIVLFFGLIHGLGFSNYFGMLLGRNADITIPLLGFNIGVEIGQIGIVMVFMLIALVFLNIIKVKFEYWKKAVSLLAIFISIYLISQSDFISEIITQ